MRITGLRGRHGRVAMSQGETTVVEVEYFERDGWHVFCSDQIAGLYVAHADLQTAYDDVPQSIETCLRLNHGVEVDVWPLVPFEEFLNRISPTESAVVPAHIAAGALQREFVIRAK